MLSKEVKKEVKHVCLTSRVSCVSAMHRIVFYLYNRCFYLDKSKSVCFTSLSTSHVSNAFEDSCAYLSAKR